jgi:hypothetical protein
MEHLLVGILAALFGALAHWVTNPDRMAAYAGDCQQTNGGLVFQLPGPRRAGRNLD